MTRHTLLVAALALAPVSAALAQCPDGAPPPCRGTSSVAGRVPVALPLNDNTWLVLPFENTARSADAELIRQASVSQLYGEMSRWEGVRVVSDDRVADLLQQVPTQRDRLGLETALGLARRVGAGRVVLGGYLAAGGRANVTARVYETRTGREVRSLRETLSGFQSPAALDSLGASFGRLARAILDVPAGGSSASAGVGTSSIAAYRAYVAGMDAMNRVDIDSAMSSLDRAIRLDSNYAMAHFQRWRFTRDSAQGRRDLQATMRLAGDLPPRARALVDGLGAAQRGDRNGLCTAAAQIIAADSSDSEGWSLLSTCRLDPTVVVENGQARMRGSPTQALRAAERGYALSPSSVTAAEALLQALSSNSFMACVPPATGICPPERNYRISLVPAGDTIGVVIRPWSEVRAAPPDMEPPAVEAWIQRLRRARAVCERLAVIADTWLVRKAIAEFALAAGDPDAAEANLGKGAPGPLDTVASIHTSYLRDRFALALAQQRPEQFQLWWDSLRARTVLTGPEYSLLGNLGEGADTTAALRQNALWRQILVGVVPAGFDTLLQSMGGRLNGASRDDFLQLTTLAGFHLRHTGPALDTAAHHPLKRYQAWAALGETARARVALSEFDQTLLARHPNTPDDGGWLFNAESHLELGDSAIALQRMQEFARRWPAGISNSAYILETRYFQSTTPRLWGRAWLLYGDLAMARNQDAEARRAYRMVVGLWEHGDPVVQPFVTRARAALAQLGG
jgi:tetratricopeptide (TPR) repeat protein/TolB-like protein